MKLNEIIFTNCQILEKNKEKLPDGVLVRVTYPICNIGELNANKRMYEAAVWEKVMSNKDLVEKLQQRALFGHAEHPQETQSNLERVSHVIFEMWSDGKQIFQKMDVLDTPGGRIIDTLLRAECKTGVSTRAEGDLEECEDDTRGKYSRVIPESYNYVTTDFTADPSTFGALPQDVKKNIVSAIGREFKNESANKSEKQFAKQLLESMKCKKDKCVNCGCCKILKEDEEELVSYKCKDCGFEASTREEMRKHMIKKHGKVIFDNIQEEKKVQCEGCKKLITQNEYADGQGMCPECIKKANEMKANVKENTTTVVVNPEAKVVDVRGDVKSVLVKPTLETDPEISITVVTAEEAPPPSIEPVVAVTPSEPEPVAKEVSPEVEKELEKEVGLEKGEKEEEEVEESKIPVANDSLVDEVVAGNILKDNKNVYFKVKSIDALGIALQPVEEGVEIVKFIEWDKVGGLGLVKVAETKVNETEDIIAMYKAAGLPAPDGKGEHTKAFHELAIKIAKGYVEGTKNIPPKSPKEALDLAYPTAMKQLGRDKAVKKAHQRSESKINEAMDDLIVVTLIKDNIQAEEELKKLNIQDSYGPEDVIGKYDVVTDKSGAEPIEYMGKQSDVKPFQKIKIVSTSGYPVTLSDFSIMAYKSSSGEVLVSFDEWFNMGEAKESKKSISTTVKQIKDLRIKEAIVRAERDKLVEFVSALTDNDLEVKILLKKIRESKSIDNDEVKALCSKVEEKAKTSSDLAREADKLGKEIAATKKQLDELQKSLEDNKRDYKDAMIKLKKENEQKLEQIEKDNEKKITEAIDKSKDETIKTVVKEYVDMKLRDGLTVHDNVRALLEDCTTLTEVNEALEKVRDANRWSALHSQPLKEVVVNKPVDPEQASVSKKVGIVFDGFSNKG